MLGGTGRKAVEVAGGYIGTATGSAGAIGVAVGDGRNLLEKIVVDGLMAMPNFVTNAYQTFQNIKTVCRLNDRLVGLNESFDGVNAGMNETYIQGVKYVEGLTPDQGCRLGESFARLGSVIGQSGNQNAEIGNALKEVGYNPVIKGLLESVGNLCSNYSDQPAETLLAAGITIAAGYALGCGIRKITRFRKDETPRVAINL